MNPFLATPSSALETTALLDAFGESLMPRTSAHQGVVAGASVLGARIAGGVVERLTTAAVGSGAPLARQLAARGAIIAVGSGLASLRESEDERLYRATLRSTGLLLRAAALGGVISDSGRELQRRYPAHGVTGPLMLSTLATAGVGLWAGRLLATREAAVEPWPVPQRNALPGALAATAVVVEAGQVIGAAYELSQQALTRYLGEGWTKGALAHAVNASLWATATYWLYTAGVSHLGRVNEKVEPGYATPPPSPLVSGGPGSYSPFEDLGLQGRRYVTDVVTPELIQEVLGEPARTHPIRTYVGFDSEPLYQAGRAELALAELERTNAFDRSYLLLVAPTGTGWVDHTMIEAAELLTRGDVATCCIQYGRYPSFLSLQKVALGRGQFRLLLWGVKQRLAERPPERRPKVLVFGESLGAWASSDVIMYQGIQGFDHYGIDRALWVGLPWFAKWSRSGMARGASTLVPPGTVHVFDRHEQFAALTAAERERLRAVILSHDNDPIAVFGPDLLVQRPPWLGGGRGRGVPEGMRWIPFVTFCQTAIDAVNAMVTVPGEFRSYGHDYRAEMTRFVLDAYQLPHATQEQVERIEETLRTLEVERAQRAEAQQAQVAPPTPTERREGQRQPGGVPLRDRRTSGARWLPSARQRRQRVPA